MNLPDLALPFDSSDIEWRVSRAGNGKNGSVYCNVLAYITARAIQARLDAVCGPENWRNEPLTVHELRPGVIAMQVGISIRVDLEWITKWDVAEPTNVEPAKGGFSGAMKRAGSMWAIGRYLYNLSETFAEVSETGGKGWHYAKLPEKQGGATYYWKSPTLPAWALPKEPEHEITEAELNGLKRDWRDKFAPESTNPAELLEGFSRFVRSIAGDFPVSDRSCWLRESFVECWARIAATEDPNGVDADVPFGTGKKEDNHA